MDAPPFEDMLDLLVSAVLRLDAGGRVRWLNPSAADLLETSPRHARGRPLQELLPLDQQLGTYLDRARTHGEPLAVAELALQVGAPPGRRRLIACEIIPLDGGDLQLECQLLDRRLAIGENNDPLRNVDAQRRLFQALAHEIKNPLSGLRGAAQLLASEADEAVPREYVEIMLRETDRLRLLVDSLLGPARAPRFAPVNIHAVLEHVRSLLMLDAPEGLQWARDYDPSLPEVEADADQLTQVLLNLANNSIDAMKDGGRLVTRTRIERHFLGGQRHRLALRVEIEDNGQGVPEALRASLFLPLVTGRAEGTGLGLSIAEDLVQRHGGLIEWHSERGRTVFAVILPLQRDAGERREPT